MLIRVFCVAEQASSRGVLEGGGGGGATGLLNKGGGSNRLPDLVTKQQAVEFPQVLTSYYYYYMQFLAARSLWTTRLLARYSIPLATCRHISSNFFSTDTYKQNINVPSFSLYMCSSLSPSLPTLPLL